MRLGHRFERHQRHDRQAGAEGQALRHAAGGTHAGERTRAGAEGDGVACGQAKAGVAQQFLHHRQHRLRMGAHAGRFARGDGVAVEQRARGQLRRSFDGKNNRHAVF
jgi:hypothetical protein